MTIRPARLDDLPALVEIETFAFVGDRISRRGFRHLLTRANAAALVEAEADSLLGYAIVLFHRRSTLARLYSIAVHPGRRRGGVGDRLLDAGEGISRERGCRALRLEVHPDNPAARRLYERRGYAEIGRYPRFYQDGADALRMEKSLLPGTGHDTSGTKHHAAD